MKAWIEPEIVIRWWNPHSWLLRLWHRGWDVMYEASKYIGCWCDSVHPRKRDAQRRADELSRTEEAP